MEISDFVVGCTYKITTKDWIAPTGEVVSGEIKIRTVLPPADSGNSPTDALPVEITEWGKYLRVLNTERQQAHLIHPETIKSAELIIRV
jgi:hypothetical protein